jgi:hypothetical protein
MNKIVGIIGTGIDGGTFLDWSIHYLIGDRFTFRSDKLGWKNCTEFTIPFIKYDLVDNPINFYKKNAHNHKKNHPLHENVQLCIDSYKQIIEPNVNILSFYCCGPSLLPSYNDIIISHTEKYPDVKFIVLYNDKHSLDSSYKRLLSYNKTDADVAMGHAIYSKSSLSDSSNRKMLRIHDMFNTLDLLIPDILQWLDVELQNDRFEYWKSIYNQWKEIISK